MASEITGDTLSYRQALEALRNGVPNRDAVAVLGCNQPEVEREFTRIISRIGESTSVLESGFGMLVAGDFGTGKSHLLEYLENQAISANFVCSRVVISKQTPLYNLEKVFKSAIDNGKVPGLTGQMIEEIALKLEPKSDEYARFFLWANSEDNGLSRVFPATLMVHERSRDLELQNEITWFWSGERIRMARVRDGLRSINQLPSYSFQGQSARQLAPQRLRFVLDLIKGAGYRGWVVLMDEIELVANYSLLQRARSYAELARWMGQVPDESYPGLIVVGTVTTDFAHVVLEEKGDRDYVGPRLRSRETDEYNIVAARAESGMRMIERDVHVLSEPDDITLRTVYDRLKDIYSQGYRWTAPDINHGIALGGRRRMRSYIRRWINEWDLRRLYPDAQPDIEETEVRFNYKEDTTLEKEGGDADNVQSEDAFH
jgi:hypothetical protein